MTDSNDGDLAALEEIARAKLGWEGRLAPGMSLGEAFALDSLRRLTLVVEVEDRFRICLEEGDEASIETVGDLLRTIRRKRGEPARDPR
jgi:acyl carrier protein